jgi:riboflavin biosynthesis pyrimidine reductase
LSDSAVSLEPLVEHRGSPGVAFPAEVETSYGGPFGLAPTIVYANFVQSIDGVAAISGVPTSSATISGGAPADRLVMAILRSVADAVVIGSGTLREHAGPWSAERAFPPGAAWFTAFRRARTLPVEPTLVVVSGSGNVPGDHPVLADAIVITSAGGAERSKDVATRETLILGDGDEIDPRAAIGALRDRGHARILVEGGPRLMGSMLEASVVDELFLTIAPKLLGGGAANPPLSDGAALLDATPTARLLDVRRAEDLLFLRYALGEA